MKLLIVTQRVDVQDPILGFFCRWIGFFGDRVEKLTVLAQQTGEYNFSDRVEICSLGKENGKSRLGQVCTFWSMCIRKKSDYDVVLVHMTPIWIVLGAPLWLLLRKPMYLWYEARGTRWPLRIALTCVRKVFSASEYGMPLNTKKSRVVGHGIDCDHFAYGEGEREEGFCVAVGRITASKNIDRIFNTFLALPKTSRLSLVGVAMTEEDKGLQQELEQKIAEQALAKRVTIGALSQSALVPLLQRAQMLIHASDTALDKAVLEAMACGTLVVSCSKAFEQLLPTECKATPEDLTAKVQSLLALSSEEKALLGQQLRSLIEERHSLHSLIDKLVAEMRS